MSARIWNLSARKGESLSNADADRRNQLMLESPSRSDGDLLRLLSGGDEGAFVEFYRKHQGMVYRFALQMSGKTEIAEEVTQDVFVVAMNSGKRYDSERGSVAAFLYGIARNFVLRALERERPYLTVLDDPAGEFEGRAVADQDIFSDLAQHERIETLRKAVLALPPAYREVVVLCDLHERDYAEAASALGCAIGTVRSRLHRARALLAEKMRAGERCAV
ncbi:MAG TPA: sigma-70 family RNA polymerase sigma factor [Bryobacteraceae bacterium]|jgi:RNA polymerase sigma-70 factor (ECF subfamily)|nr:sigma-70 family RNA polymerase sigma factor [Bryobacteraceae bacterium]